MNHFTDSLTSEFSSNINFIVNLTEPISGLVKSIEKYKAGYSTYAAPDKKISYKSKEDTFTKLVSLGIVKLASTQAKLISATNSKNYFCNIPYVLIQPKQSVPVFISAEDVRRENKGKLYELPEASLIKIHEDFLKQKQFFSTYLPDNLEHSKYSINEAIFRTLNPDDIKNNVFKLSSSSGTIMGGTKDGYFVKIEYEQVVPMTIVMLVQKFQCKPENNFSIELNYDNSDSENSIDNLKNLPDIKSYLADNTAADNVQWIERTIRLRSIAHGPRRVGAMYVAFDQGRSIISAANAGQLKNLDINPGTTWVNKQDSCAFHIGTGDNKADLKSEDGRITYEVKYNKTIEKAIEECNNAKNTPTYILISPKAGGKVSSYECDYEGGKIISAALVDTEEIRFVPIDLDSLDKEW